MPPRGRAVLGAVFLLAGTLHFARPRMYEAIMPDWLPAHTELVYASGVAEFAAAALTLHPRTRRAGGWGLVATLVGVFPANVEMALNPARFEQFPPAALWARLPLQLVMIYLVWLATLKRDA